MNNYTFPALVASAGLSIAACIAAIGYSESIAPPKSDYEVCVGQNSSMYNKDDNERILINCNSLFNATKGDLVPFGTKTSKVYGDTDAYLRKGYWVLVGTTTSDIKNVKDYPWKGGKII